MRGAASRRAGLPALLLVAAAVAGEASAASGAAGAPGAPGATAARPGVAAPETPTQLAARLAGQRHPRARWRLAEARTTDVTYDRQPDVVLLGFEGNTLLLAVVEGPVGERSRVLELAFPAGVPWPGALCGQPHEVQANVERPDARGLGPQGGGAVLEAVEAGAEAGGQGLVLVHAGPDGYCPAVHVLYDGAGLAWYRDAPAR